MELAWRLVSVNPLRPVVAYPYPLKTSENLWLNCNKSKNIIFPKVDWTNFFGRRDWIYILYFIQTGLKNNRSKLRINHNFFLMLGWSEVMATITQLNVNWKGKEILVPWLILLVHTSTIYKLDCTILYATIKRSEEVNLCILGMQ